MNLETVVERNKQTRSTTLDNGVRVMSEDMPGLLTTAVGVHVAAGARHETAAQNGISHLLEHMAFKGTPRRNAREIAEAIEDVGGELNAGTSIEQTAYYARVMGRDLGTAVDVLSDIACNPRFDPEELAREKDVVLQEIAGMQDSPDETVYELAQAAAFKDQAIGRPIIGTPETVGAVSVEALNGFMDRWYRAGDIVVSAAGAVDHDALVAEVERHLGGRLRHDPADVAERKREIDGAPRFVGGAVASAEPFEQAHVVFAMNAPSYHADTFFPMQVFSGLFGGAMSSRLFQEVRENRGLCYTIYSSYFSVSDGGLFTMHAATSKKTVQETANVMSDEFHRVVRDGVAKAELDRAKAQLMSGFLMGLESPAVRAEQMARQTMALGRILPLEDVIARIEGVDMDDVTRAVSELTAPGAVTVSIVGAGKKSQAIADAAHGHFMQAA